MQVRSPLLQTGFTKGHRRTGLFSFILFQCEPHYVKAHSLLDCLEQTDADQFSPHRSNMYPRTLPHMDLATYSPFAPEAERETESSPCKIVLSLSVLLLCMDNVSRSLWKSLVQSKTKIRHKIL